MKNKKEPYFIIDDVNEEVYVTYDDKVKQRFEQQKKALWGIFIYQVVSKIEERKRRLE
jgi:hypothetical protein